MGDYKVIDEGVSATFIKNGRFLVAHGDSCIQCENCIPVCPGNALFMKDWTIEIDSKYTIFGSSLAIIPDACVLGVDCEGACANVCPTPALAVFVSNPDKDPDPDMPGFCELYPDICELVREGKRFVNWLKNQSKIYYPINNALESEAMKWGMTTQGYIADKLDLIAKSGGYETIGKIARAAGLAGVVYGGYSAVVAVSDGNLSANDLLGIGSTALGVIGIIAGMTPIGMGALAVISAGSLVLGLVSNSSLGKNTTIYDWTSK